MTKGNIGKRREAVTGGRAAGGRATGGCCDANPNQKPRSHDTSPIAWAKLMARAGEEFPLECPNCGGDIRLIAFITDPGPSRKILTHLGEPLEPPPVSPASGPPTDWGELVQVHDDRANFQASPDELPDIDIHSLRPHSMPRCGRPARRAFLRPVCADETNPALSADSKHLGTSTIGPHPARSVPAVAPRDPPRSAVACRSAIGRPILLP
jgi:hypothetical protein